MLIINGTAELMGVHLELEKNTRHEFNMFSKEREIPFEEQLDEIEDYFVKRGWDNIEVLNVGVLEDEADITHNILQQAHSKAIEEGFAVTINNKAFM